MLARRKYRKSLLKMEFVKKQDVEKLPPSYNPYNVRCNRKRGVMLSYIYFISRYIDIAVDTTPCVYCVDLLKDDLKLLERLFSPNVIFRQVDMRIYNNKIFLFDPSTDIEGFRENGRFLMSDEKEEESLRQIKEQGGVYADREGYYIFGKADDYLDDINTSIEQLGWYVDPLCRLRVKPEHRSLPRFRASLALAKNLFRETTAVDFSSRLENFLSGITIGKREPEEWMKELEEIENNISISISKLVSQSRFTDYLEKRKIISLLGRPSIFWMSFPIHGIPYDPKSAAYSRFFPIPDCVLLNLPYSTPFSGDFAMVIDEENGGEKDVIIDLDMHFERLVVRNNIQRMDEAIERDILQDEDLVKFMDEKYPLAEYKEYI